MNSTENVYQCYLDYFMGIQQVASYRSVLKNIAGMEIDKLEQKQALR